MLRDPFLVIDMIVIVLHIEVAILFISQYRKKQDIPLRLSIGLFFVFMALAFIVLFVVRFFESDIIYLVNLYNVLLAVSMLAFCYQVERDYSKRMKTRKFFTYICIAIIPFALLLPAESIFYYGVSIAIGIVGAFPALFLAYILKKNRGQVRKRMEIALVGVIFTLLGNYGMTYQFGLFLTGWISSEYSIFVFIGARASIILGLLLLFYGFSADIFLESDWRKYLMEYYIIENKSGKALFYKNLVYASAEGEVPNTALFSGGIVGIMAMIQEFTQSEKELNVIDKGSIKILIERGDLVTVVFVVKENLSILRYILQKSVEEFESTLGVFLTTPGEDNTDVFRATGTIMDQLFQKF